MSDEPKSPPEEEEKGAEQPVPQDVSEEEDSDVTAEELKAEFHEIGERARDAGLKPLRKMVRAYVDNFLDSVDGLLSALEGSKKKGD